MDYLGGALSFIKNAGMIVGGLFIACCLYLYKQQNKMIYIPLIEGVSSNDISQNPANYRSPSEYGLLFEVLRISTTDNLNLYGWLIYSDTKEESKKNPTIVFFHENAGNIGMRLPLLNGIISKINVNIVIVGYRGYGPSQGEPSEKGIKEDAHSIMKYVFSDLSEKIDTEKLFIMGASLGGAVAIYTQSQYNYPIKGLILENTFLSIGELVDRLFPFVKYLKRFLLKNHWESSKIINKIDKPILFMMSEKDELIPRDHMLGLQKLAIKATFKREHLTPNAGHNTGYITNPNRYLNAMKKFIDECGI